ncbi:DUF4180 domain-containing protein [Phenylobacterium sp.]|uniref:DUF4180 domain-containing protein n=1 Tax=Phenylobacterium sp. TaxID=1871053 RepID=UPI0035B48BD4
MGEVRELGGAKVLVLGEEGGPVLTDRDASDLVGLAMEAGAEWVAAPVARLGPAFFDLSTRIAGETIQKLVNYRIRLAVVGDLTAEIAASKALHDFVYESNKGRHVWFVADLGDLTSRLNTPH